MYVYIKELLAYVHAKDTTDVVDVRTFLHR